MACVNPLTAWRPTTGGPLSFSGPKNNGRAYDRIQIPCGYCITCREEQARQQAVRIVHEAELHDENCFLTLTYNNANLPSNGGLNYADLIKFWKRLRKRLKPAKLRYYAVGEYGDESLRPHYHACIFGHAFTQDRIILETSPNLLWTSPLLIDCWGLGNVSVGSLNFQTARYTASYVTKKLRSRQQYVRVDETTGELIPLEQPRAFMSRNLAKAWWEQNHHQVVAHDRVVINARPQKPPKAYDKWLAAKNELAQEIVKEVRKERIKLETKDKSHARAENAHARVKRKSKRI